MTDDLDKFVDDLQRRIMDEAREAFGDLGLERWRNPLYRGALENPDGYGRITGTCGDTMQIFLKFERDHVKEASFITDGCASSTVCGSLAAELAICKTPDELAAISGQTILDLLGNLPAEEQHCAHLAAETVQEALNDYMRKSFNRDQEDKFREQITKQT